MESTERLEADCRRLKDACENARQFVDHVSHEFRTPLTVIKDACSLVRDGLAGPVTAEQEEYLHTAMTRVDDLALLVDDMLDISKVESGTLGVWRQSCQLAEIVAEIDRSLRRRAAGRGVNLDIAIPQELPAVCCDRENVGRVLINLVVNAIKFTPSGGTVRVWARACGEDIEIGVTDTGPGIPATRLESIFARFEQAGSRASGSVKGFGLGLHIARELVHLNYGQLSVISEERHGSTFWFTLPIDKLDGIWRRFLQRVNATDDRPAAVTLVQARCEVGDDRLTTDMVDEFLHSTAAADEFVWRRGDKWILALRRDEQAALTHIETLAEEWESLNRNRPLGRLPDLKLAAISCWDAAAQADELTGTVQRELAKDSRSKRILVVDDDEAIVRAASVRLRAAGYQVISANDGRLGLDKAREHHPDAIVLDVCMQDMDGIACLTELRKCAETMGIPVVMLSASVRDQQAALERGARFFIRKPYDSNNLLSAIETIAGGCS